VKSLARPLGHALLITLAAAAILWLMGRPPLHSSGTITLWGAGSRQSQMLLDWYSASHLVHGFLFYGLLHLLARRWKPEKRLVLATLVEAAWELVENSPVIIDRYREATIAVGYSGDTILNSVSDIAMMAIGFLVARKVPVWASVMIVLVLELVPLAIIRDNLTLNVWMLLAPSDALRAWQAGA
jgi:hypothetical protein